MNWNADHGYTEARRGITQGTMHRTTALGLLMMDRDWIAEAELKGFNVSRASHAVIERWRMEAHGVPSIQIPTVAELLAVEDAYTAVIGTAA